jgi:hypothetical protein
MYRPDDAAPGTRRRASAGRPVWSATTPRAAATSRLAIAAQIPRWGGSEPSGALGRWGVAEMPWRAAAEMGRSASRGSRLGAASTTRSWATLRPGALACLRSLGKPSAETRDARWRAPAGGERGEGAQGGGEGAGGPEGAGWVTVVESTT